MKTTGYSGTPLAKKLGIKQGFTIQLIDEPEYYFQLFTDMPEEISISENKKDKKDLIHFFVSEVSTLNKQLPLLKRSLEPNGMIWVSWPKKASKIQTDVTENIIRDIALENGLVDIKVCAVDEVWSGLKLVIPVKARENTGNSVKK